MESVQPNIEEQHLLRQYLLGQLNDEAKLALREQAERYFEDDDAYDEVLAVEHQLLDQYVRDELTKGDREAFAAYLSRLPDGAERLAFAQAWQQKLAEEAQEANLPQPAAIDSAVPTATPAPETTHTPTSPEWSWWSLFPRPTPVVQYALGVALLVLGISIAWFVVRPLRGENAQLRAQLAQQAAEQAALRQELQSLAEQFNAQRARATQLQAEVEFAQAQARAQARLLAQLQTPAASLLAWALTPSAARGTAPGYQPVELRAGVQTIVINAQVDEAGRYAGYSAVLQAMPAQMEAGQLVWRQARQRPFSLAQDLVLRLPARLFTATNYKLTLLLVKPDKSKLPANYYYFTVLKR